MNIQSEKPKKIDSIGGQAVIEGVMMRSANYWAVAVRQPDDKIILKSEEIKSVHSKSKLLKIPFVRGLVALFDSLKIGIQALNFSANISLGEEEVPINGWHMSLSFFAAFLMFVGLFMVTPYFVANLTRNLSGMFKSRLAFTFIEGLIRFTIFFAYVCLMMLIKDIRRVFEYHGAEHKAVNAFENKEELNLINALKYSRIHKRCGTNFIAVAFIIAVTVFSFLPTHSFVLRMGGKILLAPIIAGIAYEIIKKASKSKGNIVKILIAPGLFLQKIFTTKEPDEKQVEVAIAALKKVLELEDTYKGKQNLPEDIKSKVAVRSENAPYK